jgi:xanthine dehydrogenase iron-sulfur cluster and FAD-binding subunit A
MIMAAAALPKNASRDDVRVGLAGNICRCTGYEGIFRALHKAQGSRPRAQGSARKAQGSGPKAQARTKKVAQ